MLTKRKPYRMENEREIYLRVSKNYIQDGDLKDNYYYVIKHIKFCVM